MWELWAILQNLGIDRQKLRIMGLRMKLFQLDQNLLDEIIENPEVILEINCSEEKYNAIEIDKSWDGLKFLLSKARMNNENELSKLISSEQQIDGFSELEISDIYDVNFLTETQVQKLTAELNNVTDNEITEIFDFKAMNKMEVYGNPFNEESISYFLEYLKKVKSFYQNATNNKKAVISFIS